jgi:hypothetical protein
MPQSDPSFLNLVQRYSPPCSECGAQTMLAQIKPASRPAHALRTFRCTVCPNAETIEVSA